MIREYSTEELRQKLLVSEERFYLVDALPREAYVLRHLPGAISLPLRELSQRAAQVLPNKDVEVITYCSNPDCQASVEAARWLGGSSRPAMAAWVTTGAGCATGTLPTSISTSATSARFALRDAVASHPGRSRPRAGSSGARPQKEPPLVDRAAPTLWRSARPEGDRNACQRKPR